ncbi:prepilin peptidase [Sulfitobacter sp. S190]|uniref:prepilin peptidase n=1 Tax=Sulfitobacter sp. S190 TaxID=2867022 RepID=UPI0021A6BEB2|nr:prepilin peptidase [Sulfitobacter sp. S190]UWR23393.1 prepilin peptidase [Sulfitobacter sp. S190]
MLSLTMKEAWWFFPFVAPICLYVAYTDLSRMKITNNANLALLAVFVVIGLIVLPFDVYLWRLVGLVVVLVIGFALNALGAMGAGDSKFLAAAAPFVALGDLRLMMFLFMVVLVASIVTHRMVKHSPLRALAPGWESWHQDTKFPMGLALGLTLAIYLGLGLVHGA